MRAIKIDVILKQIFEVDVEPGIDNIYAQLDCSCFDIITPVSLSGGDGIYIDDEGLYREPPIGAFYIRGYPQVLSGHGLILGFNEEGETVSAASSLQIVKELVRFEDPHYLPDAHFQVISF